MRDASFPAPPNSVWMRPTGGQNPAPNGSIVATLGTEFNSESGDLFDRILVALASLDAPSVVAVGRDLDPARFGRQPPHVRLERYVDFEALIPQASVVMHHGGSGLFMRSVLGGASQIVFSLGADQPFNADRVEALGIGRVLDPLSASPDLIRETVLRLRVDVPARERVLKLRSEVLGLPHARAVVREIESLVKSAR
jgi:UDP:flavonoid glycosyltransferase YjiC (YdhE family)